MTHLHFPVDMLTFLSDSSLSANNNGEDGCAIGYYRLLKDIMAKYLNGKFTVVPQDDDDPPVFYMLVKANCCQTETIHDIIKTFYSFITEKMSCIDDLTWEVSDYQYKCYEDSV